MKKIKTLAGTTTVLVAGLSTLAFTASAQPVAHAGACTLGKEAKGCKLNGTGYLQEKSNVIIGFPAAVSKRGTPSELTVPGIFVCTKAASASLQVASKQTARIGGSLSFSGKVTIASASEIGAPVVKSAKITARTTLTTAKRASLSGNVKLTFADGSTCSKKLPTKLTRVLGG